MFIAHLPSGYLLARTSFGRLAGHAPRTALLTAALSGSLFPDVDLLWNFLIDERRVHHHHYWTHTPLVWVVIACVVLGTLRLLRKRRALALAAVFLAGVLMHLGLDTVVGDIAWAWPWSTRLFHLFEVPARFDWYVWSFVLHWSFGLELLIVAGSVLAWRRSRVVSDVDGG